MFISFDIETIPNTSMLDRLPEPDVKLGNLVDPAKIQAKKDEAKKSQVSKMALDPFFGRIAAIAFVSDANEFSAVIETDSDDQERLLVQKCMLFFGTDDARFASWNGKAFDAPFIFKRALMLGIDPWNFNAPPLPSFTNKYKQDFHVDLMHAYSDTSSYLKLDVAASAVLGASKDPVDPTTIPDLIKTPEGRSKVDAYCLNDTRLTHRLLGRAVNRLF